MAEALTSKATKANGLPRGADGKGSGNGPWRGTDCTGKYAAVYTGKQAVSRERSVLVQCFIAFGLPAPAKGVFMPYAPIYRSAFLTARARDTARVVMFSKSFAINSRSGASSLSVHRDSATFSARIFTINSSGMCR